MGGSVVRPHLAVSRPAADVPGVAGPGERVVLSGGGMQLIARR
jgi:hypothetical protein